MIALDTNMLVRALVADHPDQVAVLPQLMAENTCHECAGLPMLKGP